MEELIGKKYMYEQLHSIDRKQGISTIELLIAFSLITLVFVGVIATVTGNQSIALDTTLTSIAIHNAEGRIEKARALSKKSSEQILSSSVTDGIFTLETVVNSYGCFKTVTEQALWWQNRVRSQEVKLPTLFSDIKELEALAGDCIVLPMQGGEPWNNPTGLISQSLGGQGATDIDVQNGYVYVASNSGASFIDKDLFIYSFDSTTKTLTFSGALDIREGINALDVAGDYAYVAHATTSEQLKVIDISNPSSPFVVGSATLEGVGQAGSYPKPVSIYYYDERVYVGTNETAGPEFHIFDVKVPSNPTFLGSLELRHNVQDIVVRDEWAYIASTDNTHELMVVNVSNPSNLIHPDSTGFGYNAPGDNDGSSVYVSGDKVYLGREQNTSTVSDDFFILDLFSVRNGDTTEDGLLGSKDLEIDTSSLVSDIVVFGDFAFLTLEDRLLGLQIWDVSNPANIISPSDDDMLNFGNNATGVDVYEENRKYYIFTSHKGGNEIQITHNQDE